MAIELIRRDEFAVITIDRPDVLNVLNVALMLDLEHALKEVDLGDARALLVAGTGNKAFCAGGRQRHGGSP